MINENMISGSENISSIRKVFKPSGSETKGFTRIKANALGDVQNTLHSRPGALSNKTNSTKKPLAEKKQSVFVKTDSSETVKNLKSTTKSTVKSRVHHKTSPVDENDDDFHDHFLCEQADEICMEKFFLEYKYTDKQIDALTKSVKRFSFGFYKSPETGPCSDIEVPCEKNCDLSFSANNLFESDFKLPNVPPPMDLF